MLMRASSRNVAAEMAINVRYTANPTLLSSYRFELFKGTKQLFYKVVVLIPIIITILLCLIQMLAKATSIQHSPIPADPNVPDYDFGTNSTFALSNTLLYTYALLYNIVTVVACATMVANEYRWNTIKMLAVRQPSRTKLVLSKCLFALTIVGAVALSFIISWFIYALFLKYYYDLPFGINANDIYAIGRGLSYYAIINLQVFILALAALVATFLVKSVVAGFLTYIVYSGLDAIISSIGAAALNSHQVNNVGGFLGLLLNVVIFLNPFMLTSSINRLTMRATQVRTIFNGQTVQSSNQQIVLSTPIWWSWLMLAVYILLFSGLAVFIFRRRDITD